MAHGSPRLEICRECNLYGLTPRFNQSLCPTCGKPVKTVTKEEMKKRLDLGFLEKVPMTFGWRDAGKDEDDYGTD